MKPSAPVTRVGIIGLGNIGKVHLRAYREHPSLQVSAIAENEEKALVGADLSGVRIHRDYRQMLEEGGIDVALVATPAATHATIVIDCAAAGTNVLCEKPLAVDVEDGRRMIAACESGGVALGYGASYRALSANVMARELILSGRIGDVLCMREEAIGGAGPDARQGMGPVHYPPGGPGDSIMGLADHGIHMLDCLPWLVAGRLESVWGRGNISGEEQSTEFVQMGVSGGAVGLLLYNDGAFYNDLPGHGVFSLGAAWEISGYVPPNRWSAHPGFIDVYGTRGSLKLFYYANLAFLTTGEGMEQLPVVGPPAPAHFTRQMVDFATAVRSGGTAPVSGADGLAALQALHGIYESDRTGKRVTLPKIE